MPRTGKIKNRATPLDPIYQSRLVTRLVNRTIRSGKKTIAQNNVYLALGRVEKEAQKDPLEVLRQAIENIKPLMEVRPRRVGGAAYQVPIPVRGERRESLAIRWLIKAALVRSSREYRTFDHKLSAEILSAFKNEGGAIKKKQEIQRLADANKAFSHFRW